MGSTYRVNAHLSVVSSLSNAFSFASAMSGQEQVMPKTRLKWIMFVLCNGLPYEAVVSPRTPFPKAPP